MTDTSTTADSSTTATDTTNDTPKTDVEKEAFLERLNKESGKRKDAEKRAKDMEAQIADLRAQVEERENKGLPELDQLKKRLEAAEKRAQEADERASKSDDRATKTERKTLVLAAASAVGFDDPSDATRFPEFVDLDAIETSEDAEKAVKRLAKAKPKLLKDEEPVLPGRVLQDGRTPKKDKKGDIDLDEEAQMVSENLKAFLKNRQK